MFDPTTDVPSLHDLHSDATVRTSIVPDELMFPPSQPADAFPPDEPMSDDELERLCADVAPLPEPRPILTRPVQLNPAAWGISA